MTRHVIDQIPEHLMPIAQRLIDEPREALCDPEVLKQIEAYPALGALAHSMDDFGSILTSAGEQRDATLIGTLQRRARLAAEDSPPEAHSGLAWLFGVRLRWAAAGGLAFVLLAIIAVAQLSTSTIGHLEYCTSDVLISGVPVSHTSHPAIGPEDVVQIQSGSGLIRLRGGGAIAASEGARIQLLSADEISVHEGRAFIETADGQPMTVAFPRGHMTAADAVFGLDLTGMWPEIGMSSGTADVQCNYQSDRLSAGSGLRLDMEEGHQIFDLPSADEMPPWVATLLDSARSEDLDVDGLFLAQACLPGALSVNTSTSH